MRALAVEIVNKLNAEFENCFDELNTQLWKSFESKPSHTAFLNADGLKPLLEFASTIPVIHGKVEDLSYDKLKCECNVFRSVINDLARTKIS